MNTNQPIEEKKIMKIKEPALYKGIGVALSKKGRKVIDKKVEDYMITKPYIYHLEDLEFKQSEWMGKRKPKEQLEDWEKKLNEVGFNHPPLHQFIKSLLLKQKEEAYKTGREDEAIECYKDLEKTMKEYKASLIKKIGLLRQWLNEDRITEPKKMITNKDIEDWLF